MNKITLKLVSLSRKALYYYKAFLITILKKKKIKTSFIVFPTKRKRITLLKSPHVNKRAREQFELKRYKLLLSIKMTCAQTSLLKFILMNKPQQIISSLKIN